MSQNSKALSSCREVRVGCLDLRMLLELIRLLVATFPRVTNSVHAVFGQVEESLRLLSDVLSVIAGSLLVLFLV